MPGGGWEHGESLELCIQRELEEELGVGVASINPKFEFHYTGRNDRNNMTLKIAVQVELQSSDFVFGEEDIVAAEFVDKGRLLSLNMDDSETGIKQWADSIWPVA